MTTNTDLPYLNAEEQRVLGAMLEKARTTPENYPITINSLVAACNQKTSRNPVVNYDENTVILVLDALKKKGLASTSTGGSSRVTKYKHNFAIVYPLVPADLAVICLLLLRGPLTPGEINNLSGRLYNFVSIDEVQDVLNGLSTGERPFVFLIPRKPGQKEVRYAHLLGGDVQIEDAYSGQVPSPLSTTLEERLKAIEDELAELRKGFVQLKELL